MDDVYIWIYATRVNTLISPSFDLDRSSILTFKVNLGNLPGSLIDIYATSSLSYPKTLLGTFSKSAYPSGINVIQVCIPAGKYQLAFDAFPAMNDLIQIYS